MIKIFRQSLWFLQGFFAKYRRLVFLTALLSSLAVLFVLVLLPRLPKSKQSIYIGIVGKYTPTQIPAQIEKTLGGSLVTIGENQEVLPGLASGWEVLDGGKKYRLTLRSDLVWSNEVKFKLDDLVLNIPDVKMNKIEPNIVEFELPETFSPFLTVLAKPLIKDGVYSLGNYSVNDVKLSNNFLNQVTLDSPVERIVYRFFDSVSQSVLAFKLGQIDRLETVPAESEIFQWPNVEVKKQTVTNQFVAVFYNNADGNLKDKSIRQALSYAIVDKSFGFQRAVSPINPKSWAINKNVKEYEYDLEKAKDLIKKAAPNGLNIELSTSPELLSIAEKIKIDWQKAGVNTEVRVVASRPTTFQALLMAQDIPDDPDQYSLWHSTQATNFTHYESKKVDKLLEDARQTIEQDKRQAAYWDFQRFLAEDVPATILYNPLIYSLQRK